MARYINGKLVQNSEDKHKAVEDAGGTYNEHIDGDYVQNHSHNHKVPKTHVTSSDTPKRNYVENLNGEQVDTWFD